MGNRDMTKDAFGNPLVVGDKVLYVFPCGSGADCIQGEVLSFTKEKVRVDIGSRKYVMKDGVYTRTEEVAPTIVYADNLVKMFDKAGELVYQHKENGHRG